MSSISARNQFRMGTFADQFNVVHGRGQSSLPPPSASSVFAASSNTTQPQQGTSLFGSSAATPQPQLSNSIFGTSTTVPQSQQGSSLFGATTGNTHPQQSGGLFGNLTPQATAGGLFGTQKSQQSATNALGAGNAQQTQNSLTGGVFGSSSGHSQGNNLFGGGLNLQNQSIFGSAPTPNQTQNQQATMQPAQPHAIFTATIGQQSRQQETVPGVRISVNELRPTTRFNDLHEELQKAIENVDNFIINQIHLQEQCESANSRIDQLCQEMPPDVEYCTKILDTVQRALETDAESINSAKGIVRADAADAKLSFKVIQNLKLPHQFHHTNFWSSAAAISTVPNTLDDGIPEGGSRSLVEYFSRQTDDMSNALNNYKRNVGEVEAYLYGVESNIVQHLQQASLTRGREGGEKRVEGQIRELAAVLRVFENGILGVAAKIGGVRELVQDAALDPLNNVGSMPTRRAQLGIS